MRLTIEANTREESKDRIPYFCRVNFKSSTPDMSNDLHVPVYQFMDKAGPIYAAEACGYQVRDVDLQQIPFRLDQLLRSMTVANRLPTYVFIARHGRERHLVYTVFDEVVVSIPNGPNFQHVELAKVRDYLSEYLSMTGSLGTPEKPDKLHVRGVHRKSLTLIRPIFYLKKRPVEADDNAFWAPVFLSPDGKSIYTFAASAKREVPVDGGKEVLAMHKKVADALIADGRLKDPQNLRADRLFPDYWEGLKAHLKPQNEYLTAGKMKLPVYRNGNYFIAVEDRPEEHRFGLFLGSDMATVRSGVVRSFARRKLIETANDVSVVA